MATIPQLQLFSWKDVDCLGDLERLQLVQVTLPDEQFMCILEKSRGKGRNDYPIRPLWNSILAAIVFQHASIESLRRELSRNAQLRELCGFDAVKGTDAIPPPSVYTRFLFKLCEHAEKIDGIFNFLVDQLRVLLKDFGKKVACDSKAIESHSTGKPTDEKKENIDRRRDPDADWGVKRYYGIDQNGKPWEKVVKWFGYKLHLIIDAEYELPMIYSLTKASANDGVIAHEILDKIEISASHHLECSEYFIADKGYDDVKLHMRLWDKHKIKPIIDIRNMWKDNEKTKFLVDKMNVVYDYKGSVSCYCPATGEERKMAFGGFEKNRNTLKYVCPVNAYEIDCKGASQCLARQNVRISMEEDRRIFTPVARSSYKWKELYKARSSVERVNSRLDVSFCFEEHYIRGFKKMKLRCALALIVMLAIALGRTHQNENAYIRSLVRSPLTERKKHH